MKNRSAWFAIAAAVVVLLIAAPDAFAGTPGNANVGFYDDILRRFQSAATGWQSVITNAASWLFWTLVVISMVWTFGMMALRKADIGEFFAEFVRFTIFTGFFWWLLINGPNFAVSIMQSLSQLGASAGGLPSTPGQLGITPSGIVDIGFKIFGQIIDNMSFWPNKFHLSLMGGLMGLGILVMLCLIGINMLLLLVSAWFLAYAGIFFLGFGGSRWTSDMAINYYKTVLGLAVQILAMVLLIAIGKTFLDQYYATLQADISATNLKSMAALLMACVVLLALTSRIPPLLAGIITGAAVGGGGVGSMVGAGTLAAAAGMAGAAVATGGAALAAGGAAAAGGAQAVMAAFSKASENASSGGGGGDLMSAFSGGGGDDGGGGGGGGDEAGTGDTPFAQAAGFGGGGGDGGGGGGDTSTGGGADSSGGDGGGKSGGGKAAAGGGFLASAAKAGRITADAGGILAKAAGSVAKAKAAGIKDSAMARIAETTGGKMAAAIKASGAGAASGGDAGAGAAPSAGSEFTGNNLGGDGGGGDGWINQTGGFSELSEADQAQAMESHAEWQAKSEGNTFGVEDYVSYVQERQQERNAEAASFVNKKA
ncbi:P-type conjugative transfer protein TrbL [Bordetella avium]|uniref:P-type conjugative transfer protein TrbL n=1 Tax=Bordetella avium TaxID=521 RepID=UPI0002495770|nr:P-type conjugative transfer protein TrbL [Bordetella avium]AEX92219.1 TrbL protein [uncultured bacterium]RIQ80503.1 P-type conjugative transfer protein TrbL [Bordetella avium]